MHGFRHDGEEEEEETKQGYGRDKLEKRREREETIEGEGEDVTQPVLGLSARWIWHLEEQRPLTLRCGRAAACVARFVHTYEPRVSAKRIRARIRVLQPLRSPVRAGRSDTPARRRMHT